LEAIQKSGKSLMSGKDILNVSLPVQLLEPISLVERICDLWCTGPHFLRLAVFENNPLERLKYVVTFMVSGMH
jgi:Oxysterol-binding protein